jgi:hypothetical protein
MEVDDIPRAMELLRGMPFVTEVRAEGRGVQFACEGNCAADVAATMIGGGLRLNRLQPVETSLESIYLELVGADAQQQPGMTGPAGRS